MNKKYFQKYIILFQKCKNFQSLQNFTLLSLSIKIKIRSNSFPKKFIIETHCSIPEI